MTTASATVADRAEAERRLVRLLGERDRKRAEHLDADEALSREAATLINEGRLAPGEVARLLGISQQALLVRRRRAAAA